MADHFYAINKGKDGFTISDFTLATSSTTAADFEFRVADATSGLNRKDAIIALKALIRLMENKDVNAGFPII